jgi:hypothetical protein
MFSPQVMKILVWVNLVAGVVFASGGSVLAGLATFGHGTGQVVAAIIAVFGVVQMISAGILQVAGVSAQAKLLAAHAAARAASIPAAEITALLAA